MFESQVLYSVTLLLSACYRYYMLYYVIYLFTIPHLVPGVRVKLVVEFEQEPDARGLHLYPVILLAGPGTVPVHPRLGQHHSVDMMTFVSFKM